MEELSRNDHAAPQRERCLAGRKAKNSMGQPRISSGISCKYRSDLQDIASLVCSLNETIKRSNIFQNVPNVPNYRTVKGTKT